MLETPLLQTLAQLLGITGLIIGIYYLLYRQVIQKVKLPGLNRRQAFILLMTILILVWILAVLSIVFNGGLQLGHINIRNVSDSSEVVAD